MRQTPLEDMAKMFDEFLKTEQIANLFKYKKEVLQEFPDMIVYRSTESSEEHIVFGKSEQGWKGDYGLTHTDVVVSVH